MFFVKLNKNNEIEFYPYTLTDLRKDNPGISFPDKLDESLYSAFNVYPVLPGEQPELNYDEHLERTVEKKTNNKGEEYWVECWKAVKVNKDTLEKRTKVKEEQVRSLRNERLKDSDWTQLADVNKDASWVAYRQALRDLTRQEGFPWDVTWPEKP